IVYYIYIHMYMFYYIFFFSSRRRHTRFSRDWSSDVCSSDLRKIFRTTNSAIREMSYILLFSSVLVGFLIAFLLRKKELRNFEVFLAFSGGFLLSITVFELLPEVFATPSKSVGVYIMIGVLLQIFLEFLSKGAEHGHIHFHEEDKAFPWMLFISLCIHAFIEGMPISEKNNLL